MERNDLSTLAVFLSVAEERSFTRAAKRHGVSPSAMSHAIRGLEEDLGVRLLSRTTRSVAPTEAGEQLLARLRPAVTEVREALDQLSGLRNKPAGRLRLLLPGLRAQSCSRRSWRDLRATIRTSCWISPPTTRTSISLPEATMQASSSANTSKRT